MAEATKEKKGGSRRRHLSLEQRSDKRMVEMLKDSTRRQKDLAVRAKLEADRYHDFMSGHPTSSRRVIYGPRFIKTAEGRRTVAGV